ncbi:MAG: HAD family phosphatase [Lentisphaerae bacterium]|nr:HAD family phosphatase [Lentisphaerota bacterium]
MATKAKKEAQSVEKTDRKTPSRAILFELEHTAAGGRQILFDVLKSALAERGITLSESEFRRHCVGCPVEEAVAALLKASKKTRLSAEKLVAEISEGITLSFAGGSARLDPGMADLIERSRAEGIAPGGLSCIESDAARQLVEKLGLNDSGLVILSRAGTERTFPQPDVWLQLAKTVGVTPTRCLVVVSSGDASRAALAAGMKCVAVPDRYTSFQDFSGADFVCDALKKGEIDRVMEIAAAL